MSELNNLMDFKLNVSEKSLDEIKALIMEMNLKSECIDKAFDNPLFNLSVFNQNMDILIKFTLDTLKKGGAKKPATLIMDYIREKCKENEILALYLENPKSGCLLIEFYQRLKNTLEILGRYQKGDKKLEGELKRRKVL